MAKYKEIVYKLPEEKEIMETLTEYTDEFVESVRVTHPQKYSMFIEKIKKLSSKNHFDEEMLKESCKYVHKHFSLEDSTKFAKENYEIDFSKECFNKYDFNFILNEMYKIFSTIYQEEINKYVELTLAWLDHHDGKTLTYYNKKYKE